MAKRSIAAVAFSFVLLASTAAAQEQNQWHFKGGWLQATRGWLDWKQNNVDGRHCLFSGHSAVYAENDVWCYDAVNNAWEEVYPGNRSATPPYGGDLHAWGWDHVAKEYLLFDGAKVGREAFAFNWATRTWRPLGNADFTGLDDRTFISSSGVATSLDHDLMVITHGGSSASRVVRFLDLRNRTYGEVNAGSNPPARTLIQNQFLYISSLRKFLLFGGWTGSAYLNDLWLLDPVTKSWMPIAHQNPPTGRANAHMAYDQDQNIVYLVGGDNGSARVSILRLDTWTWEHLPLPAGTPLVDYPPLRRHGTAMFDAAAGFCTVAGGLSGAQWWQTIQTWCFRHTVAVDSIPPEQPPSGSVAFVQGNLGDLTVAWQRSPNDPVDVVRYELQRSEDRVNWIDQVNIPANGSETYSHTYRGVVQGPARVRAVDAFGNASPYLEIF